MLCDLVLLLSVNVILRVEVHVGGGMSCLAEIGAFLPLICSRIVCVDFADLIVVKR